MNHYTSFPSEFWDVIYDDSLNLPEIDWNLEGEELEADLEEKREIARGILGTGFG